MGVRQRNQVEIQKAYVSTQKGSDLGLGLVDSGGEIPQPVAGQAVDSDQEFVAVLALGYGAGLAGGDFGWFPRLKQAGIDVDTRHLGNLVFRPAMGFGAPLGGCFSEIETGGDSGARGGSSARIRLLQGMVVQRHLCGQSLG